MNREKITIETIAKAEEISVGYYDEDIVIVDNVKKLVDPTSAHMSMNMISFCTEGRAQGNMNGEELKIHANQVVICPPNVTLTDFMVSPDFDLKAVFFTSRILQSFLREKIGVWNELMYVHKMRVLNMEDDSIRYFTNFYEMLRMCIDSHEDNIYRTEIIQALLRAAFLGLCGRLKTMLPSETAVQRKLQSSVFQRFLDLLNNSSVKHRSVESFADELCVSPKYLSAVCKKNSGKTANEWITEHVMEDIRYYLKSTDYSIKQICGLLGFPNPSFFGKYVKSHFGMTPVQLRLQ